MSQVRPPRGLGAPGKKQWHAGIEILARRGDPTPYLMPLEQLCRTVDQLRAAEEDVQKRGSMVGKVRNPSLAVVTRLTNVIAKMMDALALTPRGEQKLTGRRPDDPSNSPMAKTVCHVDGRSVHVTALEAALCG